MAVLVLAFLVLVVSLVILVSYSLISLLLMLAMAGLVGALADAVVPGRLPGGWLGATLAGLAGSWLGSLLLRDFGPRVLGVQLIPAFVGAVALAVIAELATASRRGESA